MKKSDTEERKMGMQELRDKKLTGERALFQGKNLKISDSVFYDGESPLKESQNIELLNVTFSWKYPLWYSNNIKIKDSILDETARSGIWYTNNIQMRDCTIDAAKSFRRSTKIDLEHVTFLQAEETMWTCKDITMKNVNVRGDYFAKDSKNIVIENMDLVGNYAFDGVENVEVNNSKILSKDAFWNSTNVTVKNSIVIGEYLGWNSKNLRFENCYLQSEQGFCYIENLVIAESEITNTDLAFEYSTIQVETNSNIDSVKNPFSGVIHAESITDLILDDEQLDKTKLEIILENLQKENQSSEKKEYYHE